MLVELSVMEQRYQAVLAVAQDGWKVEVAERLGVSRRSTPGSSATSREVWLLWPTDRIGQRPALTRSLPRSRRRSASSDGSTRDGDHGGSATSSLDLG